MYDNHTFFKKNSFNYNVHSQFYSFPNMKLIPKHAIFNKIYLSKCICSDTLPADANSQRKGNYKLRVTLVIAKTLNYTNSHCFVYFQFISYYYSQHTNFET